jgi:2,3-bisphosphoglycerate-independent phosphoglycerate mutase
VDPFDLIGLAMGRYTRKEFWKTNNAEGKDKVVDEEAGTKEEEVEREVEKAVDGSGEREGVEKEKAVENAIVVKENGSSSGQVSEEAQETRVEKGGFVSHRSPSLMLLLC